MPQSEITAAILVIGDEVLSGRTQDTNTGTIARYLGLLGISVMEARTVPDDHDVIVSAVSALSSNHDYLFTTGGIGPTHDDITADAVAASFNRPIDVRDDARKLLADWYAAKGEALTEARLRMARIPDGATLIENKVSGAPGFRLENVFVMAGVPRIMASMLEALAPSLERGAVVHSISVMAEGGQESMMAAALKTLGDEMPDLSFGSYPGVGRVSLVARGTDKARLELASRKLVSLIEVAGFNAKLEE